MLVRYIFIFLFTSPSFSFAAADWVGENFKGEPCMGRDSRNRDYTDVRPGPNGREFLPVVENKHFKPTIRNLIFDSREQGRKTNMQLIAEELDYVLNQYPNHHNALYLLSRFPEKIARQERLYGGARWFGRDQSDVYSVAIVLSEKYQTPMYECYFTRAIAWRPNDPTLHLLYGIYAQKTGRYNRAEQHYRQAIKLRSSYSDAHYNLGLLLFDAGRYDEARLAAQEAYSLGYQLPALKRKLATVGYPLD